MILRGTGLLESGIGGTVTCLNLSFAVLLRVSHNDFLEDPEQKKRLFRGPP